MLEADPAAVPSHERVPDAVVDGRALASILFELRYDGPDVRHTERRFAPSVNFWRDSLPPRLQAALEGRRVGDRVAVVYDGAGLAGPFRPDLVRRVRLRDFDGGIVPAFPLNPDHGRVLPLGTLHRSGLGGVFRENRKPFRITRVGPDDVDANLNHPLAGVALEIDATVVDILGKEGDRGGRCQDWGEALLDGPGFEMRSGGMPTQFFVRDWARRGDESDDAEFYASPRFIAHIDRRAIETVTAIYATVLADGMAVLDLMSSDRSHLPPHLGRLSVTGLGMNAEELARNPALAARVVHDLNLRPALPFADRSFDAAISTVSIEYLTRPFDVVREVARVLRPGAPFVVTFSNRYFPPKVIKVWADAHPYERLGIVLECFIESGMFERLETLAVRGYPRPHDDPHAAETAESDPVFAVAGRRRG